MLARVRNLDLLVCTLLAALIAFYVIALPDQTGTVRILAGFVLVLLLPGYAITNLLFPGRDDIDGIERLILTLAMSIVAVPLLGLLLDQTPWGIRQTPIAIGLATTTAVAAWLAAYRRLRLEQQPQPAPPFTLPVTDPDFVRGALSVLATVAVFVGLVAFGLSLRPADLYTEFYVFGSEGRLEGYPRELETGEPFALTLGLTNREGWVMDYLLYAPFDASFTPVKVSGVEAEAQWQETLTFRAPAEPGEAELTFELYRAGEDITDEDIASAEPYRSLRLFTEVTEPTVMVVDKAPKAPSDKSEGLEPPQLADRPRDALDPSQPFVPPTAVAEQDRLRPGSLFTDTVTSVSNAVGIVLGDSDDVDDDVRAYLGALVSRGLITANTRLVTETAYVTSPPGEMAGESFCIFLADVIAGLEPDPGFAATGGPPRSVSVAERVAVNERYLRSLGLRGPSGDDISCRTTSLSTDAVAAILASADNTGVFVAQQTLPVAPPSELLSVAARDDETTLDVSLRDSINNAPNWPTYEPTLSTRALLAGPLFAPDFSAEPSLVRPGSAVVPSPRTAAADEATTTGVRDLVVTPPSPVASPDTTESVVDTDTDVVTETTDAEITDTDVSETISPDVVAPDVFAPESVDTVAPETAASAETDVDIVDPDIADPADIEDIDAADTDTDVAVDTETVDTEAGAPVATEDAAASLPAPADTERLEPTLERLDIVEVPPAAPPQVANDTGSNDAPESDRVDDVMGASPENAVTSNDNVASNDNPSDAATNAPASEPADAEDAALADPTTDDPVDTQPVETRADDSADDPVTTLPTYYRIAPNDTLASIAERFYGTSSEFKRIAGVNPGALTVGQEIFIPSREPLRTETLRYQIQRGDTLYSIAEQFYGNRDHYAHILAANAATAPFAVGQIVTLPPLPPEKPTTTTYVVRPNDTLFSIAEQFYGDRDLYPRITDANPGAGAFDPGRVIVIPDPRP